MKTEPKISVVVPVYNVEKYLRQCMDSIVNQTFKDIEIICVDDGSTDGSLKILYEYEKKDSRVQVISKPNSGYGASMNIGLEAATGEYIGIVESDDFIELDMYEILYNCALKNNLDVARGNYYFYNNETGENKKSSYPHVKHNEVYAPIEQWQTFRQAPGLWTSIYRREWLNESGIRFQETPGASYQDTAFGFKVFLMAKRFMMIENPLVHYRINEGSSVRSNGKVFCVCDEYAEIKRFAEEKELYEKIKCLIPLVKLGCYGWNYNRLSKNKRKEFMRRWRQEMREHLANGEIKISVYRIRDFIKLMAVIFAPFLFVIRGRF